jgi:hypothetical protein
MKKSELPRELFPARDAAIEHAVAGTRPPDRVLRGLEEWLTGEGWHALVEDWDDLMALRFCALTLEFDDHNLRSREELEPATKVGDDMRLRYARSLMDRAMEREDGCMCPSMHAYRMEKEDGKSAVIGCTFEIWGQAGPHAEWHGVFATEEKFRDHLRRSGYWPTDELDALDDATILGMWRGPRGVPRR